MMRMTKGIHLAIQPDIVALAFILHGRLQSCHVPGRLDTSEVRPDTRFKHPQQPMRVVLGSEVLQRSQDLCTARIR